MQDSSVKTWPSELNEFGKREIESIITFLDPKYKFPCDESCWDKYINDKTDTRRAKLSKKRKVFEGKVRQLAQLGNNDIFFLLLYPTKEYKEINVVTHCWSDRKLVQKPYELIYEFLKRLHEYKTTAYSLETSRLRRQHEMLVASVKGPEGEGEERFQSEVVLEDEPALERLAEHVRMEELQRKQKRQKLGDLTIVTE